MVDVACLICREVIDVEDDNFECHGCAKHFHITCDKVKKSDVNQRKGSDRLRLYCSECIDSPALANIENNKTILKFVYKIDASAQQQVASKCRMVEEMQRIKQACITLKTSVDIKKAVADVPITTGTKESKSFASVLRSAVKPAVIIKPKQSTQNSADIMKDIKSKINYKDVNVYDMRNVSDGGIAVTPTLPQCT